MTQLTTSHYLVGLAWLSAAGAIHYFTPADKRYTPSPTASTLVYPSAEAVAGALGTLPKPDIVIKTADKGTTSGGPAGQRSAAGKPDTCLPFFDYDTTEVTVKFGGLSGKEPVDMSPPPAAVSPFDLAVINACGPAGKTVSEEEFRRLMLDNPGVLNRIMEFTGGRVFPDGVAHNDPDAFLNDLTKAWFSIKAFDHIMCGQPGENGTIGGLHLRARFLQLQHFGQACRLDNYRQNEAIPALGIYSMGVAMQGPDGQQWHRHSIKGYSALDAEGILKVATLGFSQNPVKGDKTQACLLTVRMAGKEFTTVLAMRESGIRTHYADATPREPDRSGRVTPECTALITIGDPN